MRNFYSEIFQNAEAGEKMLAILIDPEKFEAEKAADFLRKLPKETTHLFVGGSTVDGDQTQVCVNSLKTKTGLPIILFPGNHNQICEEADALLFLSLLSGRNPEYLIGQQLQAVKMLKNSKLEIIPTGYILIDGGRESAVERVSKTRPIAQNQVELIVETALAAQYLGKKLIYLEAGSGAAYPVSEEIISAVKEAIKLPLIVGGGIRNEQQKKQALKAGADMLVMGTYFEKNNANAEYCIESSKFE
ncbi:phosphoglycerol geranylgeranyltransferase [Salegentibacter sp. HM20]